jgi:GMP synthase-like glutamine amidotransferase
MKPVLILQHQTPENLAYLATWLNNHNIPFVTFNAETQGNFPQSIEPYSALAVMGGAMSANDPLLSNRQAEILILQAMYRDIPVIGHCLGGQLMARALGGTVIASPQPEIGWQSINWQDHERTKPWFGDNPTSHVIHWHYETFSIPKGATLLASSKNCPNQAFSVGKHLAMQFHIEIDQNKVQAWVNDHDPQWKQAQKQYDSVQNREQILADTPKYIEQHQKTADKIYTTWLKTTEWADKIII